MTARPDPAAWKRPLVLLVGFAGVILVVLGTSSRSSAQLEQTPILFQTTRNGTSDIFAMDPNGRRQVPVITSPANEEDAAWRRNGQGLAFSSDRTGSWQIYTTGFGQRPVRLTRGPRSNVDPTYSPDGNRIAFESNRDGNWQIYIMDANGSLERNLSDRRGSNFDPTWSVDNRHVAFAHVTRRGADIYVADAATGRSVRLVNSPAHEFEPAFSPSGSRIAFTRLVRRRYEIYVMDLATRETVSLTDALPGQARDAEWSPDESRVLFTWRRYSRDDLEVAAVRASGGRVTNLSRIHDGDDAEADARASQRGTVSRQQLAGVASHGPGFQCGNHPVRGTAAGFKLIPGDDGHNRICGGAGKNWLKAFKGDDKLAPGRARDRAEGHQGNDFFLTDDGQPDELWGGPGTDRIWPDKSLDKRHEIEKVNP